MGDSHAASVGKVSSGLVMAWALEMTPEGVRVVEAFGARPGRTGALFKAMGQTLRDVMEVPTGH